MKKSGASDRQRNLIMAGSEMELGRDIIPLDDRHHSFLRDESGLVGRAATISFPESEEDVCHIIAQLARRKSPVTVQGSRTGLSGGAVPVAGHILNMSRMKNIVGMAVRGDSHFSIRVQPGVVLAELNRRLHQRSFDTSDWDHNDQRAFTAFSLAPEIFWPPDPTEDSASIGGIAANDSQGIGCYHYGSARRHIRSIRVVDPDGKAWQLERGSHHFIHGQCTHPNGTLLTLDRTLADSGSVLDLVDLYLGSEGLLGPITELTLDLLPLPPERWAIVFFFTTEDQAAGLIDDIRLWPNADSGDAVLTTIDFYDEETLLSIRQLKSHNSRLAVLPDTPAGTCAAVYLELQGEHVEEVEDLATRLLAASAVRGCDPDSAWAFSGEQELGRARLLCHAAQEAMLWRSGQGQMTVPTLGKFSTDMRMVGCSFAHVLGMYRSDLKRTGLKAGIFGHAGDLHLQVHFLPENDEAYFAGKRLIDKWALEIVDAGGWLANGHGVGKLHKGLFRTLPLPRRLDLLCTLKPQLDPTGMFNPANMLDGTFDVGQTSSSLRKIT